MSPRRFSSRTVPCAAALVLFACAPDEQGLFGNATGVGGGLATSTSSTSSAASGPETSTGQGAGSPVGSGGAVGSGGSGSGASGAGGSGAGGGGGSSVGPGSGGATTVGPGSGGDGGGVGPGPTTTTVGPGGGQGGDGGQAQGTGGQGGGTGGAPPVCQDEGDCGQDSFCADFTCAAGACSVAFAPVGTAIDPQAGDCVHDECDGAGVLLEDVPDAPGTYCIGEGVCDGATVCVGCLGPDDCDSGFCENQTCQPCDDGQDCGSGFCACQVCVDSIGLFISEYIEGSVSNKAIELFNPTDEVIDLDGEGCEILIYANGAAEPTSAEGIEGTIAPGDTRSICAVGAGFGLSCDQLTLNLGFSGDDAVEVVCGGTTIDVVGRIGEDPGAEWGTGNASTADNTIRRRPGIVSGDPDGSDAFDPSIQWIGRPNNDSDDLNDHTLCP